MKVMTRELGAGYIGTVAGLAFDRILDLPSVFSWDTLWEIGLSLVLAPIPLMLVFLPLYVIAERFFRRW